MVLQARNRADLGEWETRWPEEASDWLLTEVTPKLWAHAAWMSHTGEYPRDHRSMRAWVDQLGRDSGALCARALPPKYYYQT